MNLTTGSTPWIVSKAEQAGVLRNQLAYILATVYHETNRTMEPIKEYGGPKYFHKMYDKNGSRPHVAKQLGNTNAGDGVKFAGRGFVQLTGRANYKKASDKLGTDFVKDPDAVMSSLHVSGILVVGMLEGWFTGRKLSDYITLTKSDYVGARKIINGVDKKHVIAKYAHRFDRLLLEDGYGVEDEQQVEVDPIEPKPLVESTTAWSAIGGVITTALASISSLNPWLAGLVVVVSVGFAVWIIKERKFKLDVFGV